MSFHMPTSPEARVNMAESIQFNIAAKLLSRLGSSAIQQIGLAWGLGGELRKIENKISTIKDVLLDAQEQQMSNHTAKGWLERLKLILYDVDDLLDDFATETKRKRVETQNSVVRKVYYFFTSSRYILGRKLKDVGKRLDGIVLQMHHLQFVVKLVEWPFETIRREETSSFVNSPTIIGREHEKEKLVTLLLSSEENDFIIPIVGLGGLGKTTLAQLVYNDDRIQKHFTKRLWVYISNDFDLKRILIKMLQVLEPNGKNSYSNEGLELLQKRVRNMLSEHKFLLFLDDVWNEDHVEWKKLEDLLMTQAKGSRIVVTTRSKMVASIVRTYSVEPYELKGLSDNQCLEILVKWAFKDGDETRHQNLVNIGGEIVKKCGGVPLAARSVGAFLFSKTNERDWLSVRDRMMWALV